MPATTVAPTPKFLTAEQLLNLWEAGKMYEVVGNDQLMEFDVSKESSRVAGEVYYRLRTFADTHPLWVFPENTSYRCFPDEEERTRRADVSVILLERMPSESYQDEGHCTTSPDLVVEVISPKDLAYEVNEKRDEWLAAGVRVVWTVFPNTRSVQVNRADGTYAFLRAADTLTAPDLLPGFAVPVADLFRKPGEPARTA
jgi:Uma2 family endonuclease